MKKTISILILSLYLVIGIFCQSSASLGPIDLIVILDTSASMSNYYNETSEYLIGPFLQEFLRIGDTFHLISFSSAPKLEISRRVEGIGDVETVIARLLLMYPLDPDSDLAGALSYAERYASSLTGSRPKKLVLITDGDIPDTQSFVSASSSRLQGLGTELQYIKMPVTGNGPSSGRPRGAGQTAQTAAQSTTPAIPPVTQTALPPAQPTQQTTQTAQTPVEADKPPVTQAQSTETQQTPPPPVAVQEPPTPVTPVATEDRGTTQAQTAQTQAPSQTSGTAANQTQPSSQSDTSRGSSFAGGLPLPLPLLIVLAILILLILGLIIFFVTKRLQNSPNRVIAQAVAPQDSRDAKLLESYAETQRSQARPPLEYSAATQKPLPKDKYYDDQALVSSNGGPLMLNLFVADQNTAIGRRNIHSVKSGYTFSIGGGKSDFLIFLVPIPPHIADVQYDGRNCTLIPRKPQYFPDIGSETVHNCIGKTVRIVSDKKYELYMRIEKYEDPLAALNKLLLSIKVPGPPER